MPVVQKCNSLKQYCEFIEIVARHKAVSKENPQKREWIIGMIKQLMKQFPQCHGGKKHAVLWDEFNHLYNSVRS